MHHPSPHSDNSPPRSLRDWLEQIAHWNPPPPADRQVADELAKSHSRVPVPPGTESPAVEPLASWLEPGDSPVPWGEPTPVASSAPREPAVADRPPVTPPRETRFPVALVDRSPGIAPAALDPLPESDRWLSDLLVRGLDSRREPLSRPRPLSFPLGVPEDAFPWTAPFDEANEAWGQVRHDDSYRPPRTGRSPRLLPALASGNDSAGRPADFPENVPFTTASASADRGWPPEPGRIAGGPEEPLGPMRARMRFDAEPDTAGWTSHWTELARRVTDLESALAEG